MRQGEIWQLDQHKVLVVSEDGHNETPGADPRAIFIVRGAGIPRGRYVVALSEQDPVSGVLLVPTVGDTPQASGGVRLGMITGATMGKVVDGLQALFSY